MAVSTLAKQKLIEMAFNEWTTQQLKWTFNLNTLYQCDLLDDWLNAAFNITDEADAYLEKLRKKAVRAIAFWNEDELKHHFISPLMNYVDFETDHYHAFLERKNTAQLDKYKLNGKVNLMVASGEFDPAHPYFFFHEYKKEKGGSDDPIAQLLCAMIVGQLLNKNNKPIYGAYVIERNWFFVVLNEKDYCISDAFVATRKEHLKEIYIALNNIKIIIDKHLR